jgi:hypothetical protein
MRGLSGIGLFPASILLRRSDSCGDAVAKAGLSAVLRKPQVIYQRPEKQSYSMWKRLPAARFDFAVGSRSHGVFI